MENVSFEKHPLPVDKLLGELTSLLRRRSAAVVIAPTGSGKTTRVPPALEKGLPEGQILVLEPRRVAARAAARRMAAETGRRLGGEIGYQVRFEHRFGPDTRILVVTEGVLLNRLQSDPFLEPVAAVVFDEFHERNLASDLALAMVRQVQREVRPELKVVVMSATLDTRPVVEFLGGCPVLETGGRSYPLTVRHAESEQDTGDLRSLPRRAARAVRRALREAPGDVLVFLPGVGEIRRVARALKSVAEEHDLLIAPLYGDLPARTQDRALTRQARRRVVPATNVAETSVTVEGVGSVVDSGLVRLLRFDPATGLDRLELSRISRASAEQRAGRAGREGPGTVYRLWTEYQHRGLPERTPPEIQRVDLAGPVLQLLAWGEPDPASFPWFESPEPAALAHARQLLEMLGAVDADGITAMGKRMAALPLHPRLARLLLEGVRLGVPRRTSLLCALLQERNPFWDRTGSGQTAASPCDLEYPLDALERFADSGNIPATGSFNRGAARFVLKARNQLLRRIPGKGRASARDSGGHRELRRALLAAFPDRLIKARESDKRRGVMVGGRGVRLARESGVRGADLLVGVEISESAPGRRSEALVRKASAIQPEWIDPDRLDTRKEVEFNPESRRVEGLLRTRFMDLVIEEKQVDAPAGEASRVLAEAAAQHLDEALDLQQPEIASFLARVRWLREWMPELGLPAWRDRQLRDLLPALAAGRRSFAELRKAPVLDFLRGQLSFQQRQALDREAPERLQVPGGSRVRVQYEPGKPPVLAVRIQEMFGLAETPRLAGGRAPVLLHLLAPNSRPQQVTQDLAGFWEHTYPQVRKELKGRYPKHAWPEDPLGKSF